MNTYHGTENGSPAQDTQCLSNDLESNVGLDQNNLDDGTYECGSIATRHHHHTAVIIHSSKNSALVTSKPKAMIRWSEGIVSSLSKSSLFGLDPPKQTDEALQSNLKSLARMLLLLREYKSRFGIPEQGGPRDQEFVLREINKDLYQGGAPIWALDTVMKKAAEGLTGTREIDFWLLPRKSLMVSLKTGATAMFATKRGFCLYKLDAMEPVVTRLASFVSNTNQSISVPSRFPHSEEFRKAAASTTSTLTDERLLSDRENLAATILSLSSEAEGLFSFINLMEEATCENGASRPSDNFWEVEDSIRALFVRLVTIEAMTSIEKIDANKKVSYSPVVIMLFRMATSAGGCAIWFNGSWYDILVSALLGALVGFVKSSTIFSTHERILLEVVASLMVGLVAGLTALQWPYQTCFGAMALSGVIDILHGFRVVFAIVEVMSKHTVAGGADLLEGILFTGLIAYFLQSGQFISAAIMGDSDVSEEELTCSHGISEWWYLLFVPVASISWSGLFTPNYSELVWMAFHGALGFVVTWAISSSDIGSGHLSNFIAAMSVTLSAGIISRLTGRQAVGNTVSGIFGLVPGAYLVRGLYSNASTGFLESTVRRCIVIGVGAWAGTLLCSPKLLGTTCELLARSMRSRDEKDSQTKRIKKNNSMLFF
jgi:uncharacterized membrane protein YjjP (DUF1212 family)